MGAVAKRTLKKSYYDKAITNTYNEEIYNIWNRDNEKENVKNIDKKRKKKQKLLIQSLTVTTLVIIISAIKYFNMETIKNSKFSKNIINEFNENNSFSEIKKGTINVSNKVYKVIAPIIPEDIIDYVNNKSKKSINIYDEEKNKLKVYEEKEFEKEDKDKEKLKEGIGSSQDEDKIITALSSINTEDDIIQKVKSSKIKFVVPVKGTVSSSFGAREEIFEGIGTFHTGVDIAADKGIEVISSTEGTVIVATYNKYNGNYIEITNGKITTKYCHMDKLLVKEGKKVKIGEKIGLVGSTGLSTGPHLHFEILYDGIKVNPQKVIDL